MGLCAHRERETTPVPHRDGATSCAIAGMANRGNFRWSFVVKRDQVRSLRFLAASLVALTMLAGCNERNEPGPDAVDVRVVLKYDVSEGAYIEGSISYIRVERLDGELVFERPLSRSTDHIGLDPGEYRLISFQRPCEGNCGSLDPPTDRCERRIRVTANPKLTVRITARPTETCEIELVQVLGNA